MDSGSCNVAVASRRSGEHDVGEVVPAWEDECAGLVGGQRDKERDDVWKSLAEIAVGEEGEETVGGIKDNSVRKIIEWADRKGSERGVTDGDITEADFREVVTRAMVGSRSEKRSTGRVVLH